MIYRGVPLCLESWLALEANRLSSPDPSLLTGTGFWDLVAESYDGSHSHAILLLCSMKVRFRQSNLGCFK